MDFIYVFKRHWRLAEGERRKICLYFMLHMISVFAVTTQPIMFAMVINVLQSQDGDTLLRVLHWLLAYVACFYIFEVCHRLARGIELGVAYRNKKRFVLNTYLLLQSLPLDWHTSHHSGNIVSRVGKASDALLEFGQSTFIYITALVQFVMSVVVLWLISPVISIVAVAVGIILVTVTRICYKKTVPEYRKLNEGFYKIAETLQDGISNITTIIILRLGKCIYKDLEKRFDANFCHMKRENRYTQFKCHFNSLLEIFLNVGLIFFYIVTRTKNQQVIMLGAITAIFQYLSQIMEAFWFYGTDYEKCIHWRADLEAVDEIFAGVREFHETQEGNVSSGWKLIEMDFPDFRFDGSKTVLKQISIKLKRGKKIAFVGESGSGKSTLLKLIRGIYPLPDGSVRIDGKLMESGLMPLAGITALIPQEPEVFDRTVLYNIVMGLEYSEEELSQALYLSGFESVLHKLPDGIHSKVSEDGVNLSGGEKQRLALARGIFSVKDSSIVLLDEPTASLDAETELKVYKRMLSLFSENGQCVVSVLHRLNLLYLFDYIYVFKDGCIIEQGTLEELKEKRGYFSELWNSSHE